MPVTAFIRRALLGAAVRSARAVLRRPQLKYLARTVLAYFPSLRIRLHGMMYKAALQAYARRSHRVQADADLSPRSLRMAQALKRRRVRHPSDEDIA